IEVEEERGACQRWAEGPCANRGLDRPAGDLRILQLAREAMVDGKRAVGVAALRGEFRDEEFEHGIGGGRALIDFNRVFGSLFGHGGTDQPQGQCRHRAKPPRSARHFPPSHARRRAAPRPIIERFERELRGCKRFNRRDVGQWRKAIRHWAYPCRSFPKSRRRAAGFCPTSWGATSTGSWCATRACDGR